jgi:hypothetical protein
MANMIPAGLSFEQALRRGYVQVAACEGYLRWLRRLPCDRCGKMPSEASHLNSFKSQRNKAPDLLAIPECRTCHELYERGPPDEERRLARAALYILQAFYLGILRWHAGQLTT